MDSAELGELLETVALGLDTVQKNFPHELITKIQNILNTFTVDEFAGIKATLGLDLDQNLSQVLKGLDDTFKQEHGQPSKAMEIINTCRRLQRHKMVLRVIAKCLG